MTQPILSREEIQEIERKCDITFFVPDDSETWPGTYINVQQLRDYTARIEAAVLERVCGEPIPYGYEFLDLAGENHFARGSLPAYAQSEIVPLYTLKDRQS